MNKYNRQGHWLLQLTEIEELLYKHRSKRNNIYYLSKFGPRLLFLHSSVRDQVVKYLTWAV